jgi:hypothetical protein
VDATSKSSGAGALPWSRQGAIAEQLTPQPRTERRPPSPSHSSPCAPSGRPSPRPGRRRAATSPGSAATAKRRGGEGAVLVMAHMVLVRRYGHTSYHVVRWAVPPAGLRAARGRRRGRGRRGGWGGRRRLGGRRVKPVGAARAAVRRGPQRRLRPRHVLRTRRRGGRHLRRARGDPCQPRVVGHLGVSKRSLRNHTRLPPAVIHGFHREIHGRRQGFRGRSGTEARPDGSTALGNHLHRWPKGATA